MIIFVATYWPGQESAFQSWSLGFRVLAVVAICSAIAFVYYLGKRLLGRGSGHPEERGEAVRLGISVSDVERDLPEFGRGNQSCKLVRGPCVRYSLPRYGEGNRSHWLLLQRTKREGAQLPNDYLLQGDVSQKLRQALTKLAEECSEEYFEFEGTPTEVSVFWEEWGGADRVQRVHQVLQTLAGL
jgi:hypothetical protein